MNNVVLTTSEVVSPVPVIIFFKEFCLSCDGNLLCVPKKGKSIGYRQTNTFQVWVHVELPTHIDRQLPMQTNLVIIKNNKALRQQYVYKTGNSKILLWAFSVVKTTTRQVCVFHVSFSCIITSIFYTTMINSVQK